jgi:hypothetical protein
MTMAGDIVVDVVLHAAHRGLHLLRAAYHG